MSDFAHLLQELDTILRNYNPVNYELLMPPLNKDEIKYYLEKLNITDENIKIIFEWKNGIDTSKGLVPSNDFLNFGVFISLQSILKTVNLYPEKYAKTIPIVGNAAGDSLLFNNESSIEHGKIELESTSLLSFHDEMFWLYESLVSMIESNINFYKSGAFVYNKQQGVLDVNTEKYWEIAEVINRKATYWKMME